MNSSGLIRSPWRFVLLLLALAFLLVGFVTIAGPIADGKAVSSGAVVSGVVVGVAAMALGGYGAWRSLIMGVKYSPDALEVRSLERTRAFSWCEVEAVDTRLTPGDVLIFLKQADIVLVLKSGEEEWLSAMAVYSFSSAVPKRVEARADALRAALDAHRSGHATSLGCGRDGG